jgi:hypothetical protein
MYKIMIVNVLCSLYVPYVPMCLKKKTILFFSCYYQVNKSSISN